MSEPISLSVRKSETEIILVHTGAAEVIFSLLALLADPNGNYYKLFQERWNLGIELSFAVDMTSYLESCENLEELLGLLTQARAVVEQWPDPIPHEIINDITRNFFKEKSLAPVSRSYIELNFKLIEDLFLKRST